LAAAVTEVVHGAEALSAAQRASEVLFGGDIEGLGAAEVADIFQDVPSTEIAASRFDGEGMQLADLMVEVQACKSKGEARRLLQGGGVSLNNRKWDDPNQGITRADTIEGRFLVLRKGRKNYFLVKVLG
ncbi:MAG: tyrosine--tRNA ligase, partial [Calditrichaeota bacterium]|nr:tyrosine--tRNA ligase [Calditrichota bacterium]